jgi:hypothetical protein
MQGDIVFKPIGYTPWPVEEGFEGIQVRVAVGPVRKRELRSYMFKPLLGGPGRSELVQVCVGLCQEGCSADLVEIRSPCLC